MQESHDPTACSQMKRPSGPVGNSRSYGIDAPYLLPILGALLAGNVVHGVRCGSAWPFVGALVVLAWATCGMYTSRRGKFVAWAELLDQIKVRGDERVLDLRWLSLPAFAGRGRSDRNAPPAACGCRAAASRSGPRYRCQSPWWTPP